MFFHPNDLLTREELLEKIWAKQLTPPQRAHCLVEAQSRGVTYMDLMRELAADHDAAMKDPVQREAWSRFLCESYKAEAMPFGQDPLLRKDGDR